MPAAKRIRYLLFPACIFSGLLAGGDVYRYVIEVPAWRYLNVVTWAEYCRHADLGNGIVLFPVEAIVSTLLLIAASVSAMLSWPVGKLVSLPIHIATLLAITGLIFTLLAAPIMLRIPTLGKDPKILQQAFHQFHFWGMLRAVAQVLSFITASWAMLNINSSANNN